jgi:hypothetical protein
LRTVSSVTLEWADPIVLIVHPSLSPDMASPDPFRYPPITVSDSEGDLDPSPSKRPRTDTPSVPVIAWSKPILRYAVNGSLLLDIGAECILCKQLRLDKAMMRSACACGVLVCFGCLASHVKGEQAFCQISFNRIPDFMSLSDATMLSFTLYRCPQCRQSNVPFLSVNSPEWKSLVGLYSSLKASLESKRVVNPVDFKLTCGTHTHDSNQEWIECKNATFDMVCPVPKCGIHLTFDLRSSLAGQVRVHLVNGCAGQVECPYCEPLVFEEEWHSAVSVFHVFTHYELHVKLYALWMQFNTLSAPNYRNWWDVVRIMFRDVDTTRPCGGAPAHEERSDPLSRVVNGVAAKKEWAQPWMDLFLQGMRSESRKPHATPNHMTGVSFSMFFNSAFQAKADEGWEEEE